MSTPCVLGHERQATGTGHARSNAPLSPESFPRYGDELRNEGIDLTFRIGFMNVRGFPKSNSIKMQQLADFVRNNHIGERTQG